MAAIGHVAGCLVARGWEAATRSRLGREARDFADLVTDGVFYALPGRFAPKPSAEPRVALVVDFDRLRAATLDEGGAMRELSPPLLLDTDARVLAETLRSRGALAANPVALILSDECYLSHDLRLPPGPNRLIDALVVSLATDLSPFGEGEALYAWVLRGRDRDGLSVEACAFDRLLVEPVLERLRSVHLTLGAVGRLVPGTERVNWLSPPGWAGLARPSPWSALRGLQRPLRLAATFTAIVLAAALFNVSYASLARGWLGDDAERALATARSQAVLRADRERLDAARGTGLARVALLDDIAARLPDSAWLEGVQLGVGDLEMSVVAASASEVLRALAGVSGLRDLAFKGPVIEDVATRRDRFRLGATIVAPGALQARRPAP